MSRKVKTEQGPTGYDDVPDFVVESEFSAETSAATAEISSTAPAAEKLKCGEVFYTNDIFLFECLFCEKKFQKNQIEFIEHLVAEHISMRVEQSAHQIEFENTMPGNATNAFDDLNLGLEDIKTEENDTDHVDEIIKINNKPSSKLVNDNFMIEDDRDVDDDDDDDYEDVTEQLVAISSNLKRYEDGLYHCPKENCKTTFNNLNSARNHIKNKHPGRGSVEYPEVEKAQNENSYNCAFRDCKHSESTIELIQRHMYDEHLPRLNKIEKFPCSKCDRIYNLKSSLRDHLKKNHFIVFDDDRVFIKEIRTFKSDKDGKYHCPKCQMKFAERQTIRAHLKVKHEIYFNELIKNNKKIFEKPEGFDDRTPKPRVNTKELKISEKDGLWHCPHCTEFKYTKRRLYIHIKTKHIDNTVCKVCEKKLASSDSLEIHMKRHSDPTFKCDYCEKSFFNRSNLMSHVRMHLGQKNYQCKYCDKRFTNCSTRKLHEKMVHEKKKDYQCETCGKEFFTHYDLKKHYLRHTGERAYQCEICQKSFYEPYLLKDHFKLHSGLKPHGCEICGQKYARKGALHHHMKTHTKVKQQFNCEICEEKFTKNSELTAHMTTHEYIQSFS